MFIGKIGLNEGELLFPGQTRDLVVTFLNVEGLAEKLKVGTEWRLQEGIRLVGTARIKRVIEA